MNGEDGLRTIFRRVDAQLGHAPPDLSATIRQARREQLVRRVMGSTGIAVIVAAVGIVGWLAMRPVARQVAPLSSPSANPIAPSDRCNDLGDRTPSSSSSSQFGGSARDFVDLFMQRRIAGSGAEEWMTDGALTTYCQMSGDTYDSNAFGGAGTLCLYRCGAYKVIDYNLQTEPLEADANSYAATITVHLSDGEETVRYAEQVVFGQGANVDGDHTFAVRGVEGGVPVVVVPPSAGE